MVQASTVRVLAVVDLYKRVLSPVNPIDGIASNAINLLYQPVWVDGN